MRWLDNNISNVYSGVPSWKVMPWSACTQAGTNTIYKDSKLDVFIAEAQGEEGWILLDVEEANLDKRAIQLNYAEPWNDSHWTPKLPGWTPSGFYADDPTKPPRVWPPDIDSYTEKDRRDHIETWQIDRCSYAKNADPNLNVGVYFYNSQVKKELPDTSREQRQAQMLAVDGVSPGLFVYTDWIFWGAYFAVPYADDDVVVTNWINNTITTLLGTFGPYYTSQMVLGGLITKYYSSYAANPNYGDGNISYPIQRRIVEACKNAGMEGIIWSVYRNSAAFNMTDPWVKLMYEIIASQKHRTMTLEIKPDTELTLKVSSDVTFELEIIE